MMLKNKVAVVYGAAGGIGRAVSLAFASQGAKVFVTGRRRAPVEALAKEIVSAGGHATAAEVDALDEHAIDSHLKSVIDSAGRLDISFNAVGVNSTKVVGASFVEIDLAQFTRPIVADVTTFFLTARLAARHMVKNKSGVILTVSSVPARMGTRMNGGYGSAHAAKEALTRDLSVELAPHGIRVVALRPHGMPETQTMRDLFDSKPAGLTWEQFEAFLASTAHSRRVMRAEELGAVAAFVASDRASAMTGITVNLTMGAVAD